MNFFNDHKKLFSSALAFFLCLTLIICIFPALNNQKIYKPLPGSKPLSEAEIYRLIPSAINDQFYLILYFP